MTQHLEPYARAQRIGDEFFTGGFSTVEDHLDELLDDMRVEDPGSNAAARSLEGDNDGQVIPSRKICVSCNIGRPFSRFPLRRSREQACEICRFLVEKKRYCSARTHYVDEACFIEGGRMCEPCRIQRLQKKRKGGAPAAKPPNLQRVRTGESTASTEEGSAGPQLTSTPITASGTDFALAVEQAAAAGNSRPTPSTSAPTDHWRQFPGEVQSSSGTPRASTDAFFGAQAPEEGTTTTEPQALPADVGLLRELVETSSGPLNQHVTNQIQLQTPQSPPAVSSFDPYSEQSAGSGDVFAEISRDHPPISFAQIIAPDPSTIERSESPGFLSGAPGGSLLLQSQHTSTQSEGGDVPTSSNTLLAALNGVGGRGDAVAIGDPLHMLTMNTPEEFDPAYSSYLEQSMFDLSSVVGE